MNYFGRTTFHRNQAIQPINNGRDNYALILNSGKVTNPMDLYNVNENDVQKKMGNDRLLLQLQITNTNSFYGALECDIASSIRHPKYENQIKNIIFKLYYK